jgi:hypothetical protein
MLERQRGERGRTDRASSDAAEVDALGSEEGVDDKVEEGSNDDDGESVEVPNQTDRDKRRRWKGGKSKDR